MTMSDLGIYVYGLVADGALAAAPDLPGVDAAHAVECLSERDVCALVSKVGLDQFDEQPLREHLADMAWVEQTARRHQQVLDSVLDKCTPIPMRLCTLYGDEDGLRQMLDRQQENLAAALSELDGKLEWGVQVFAGPRPPLGSELQPATRPVGSEAEPALGPGVAGGTAYLQNKLAARRASERSYADLEGICDRLHAELCTIALACRLGTPQRPEISNRQEPMILNAFYLVPNKQRDRLCARVAELRDQLSAQGIDLQLTGPWPPYNFVTSALGGEQ